MDGWQEFEMLNSFINILNQNRKLSQGNSIRTATTMGRAHILTDITESISKYVRCHVI